jgi:hypothetical protein
MSHEHDFHVAFTDTKGTDVVKSFLRCTVPDCDYESELGLGWKVVDGAAEKQFENTWAGFPSHITH